MTLKTKVQLGVLAGFVALAMGQACLPTPDGGSPDLKGNGDYYGGMMPSDEQMAASIESLGNSIKVMSDDSNPDPEPPVISVGDCRPLNQVECRNGTKVELYSDCTLPGSTSTMRGFAGLQYTDLACRIDNEGDRVNASHSLVITGSDGAKLYSVTSDYKNYLGEVIAGGSYLQKTATGWESAVIGKSVIVTGADGSAKVSYSQKSLSPFIYSINPHLSLRVDSGRMSIYHNLARYTATYGLTDVTWDNTCCHPVSGTLSLEFAGAYTGQAQAEYLSCGTVRVSNAKETRTLTLKACP